MIRAISRLSLSIPILLGLAWTALPSATAAAPPLLFASFNDKTAGAPIGTGGAAVGEPIMIEPEVIATVTATPMTTNSLELADNSTLYAQVAIFEFVGSTEVTSGPLSVGCDLWFPALEDFILYIREQGSSGLIFGDLAFVADGNISLFDSGGYVGVVGAYAAGQQLNVRFEYDLSAGTYDLYLDGSLAVDDELHNVTTPGRGIGRLEVGVGFDSNASGTMYVDNIMVSTDGLIFADGFEAGSTVFWSASL